jgi:hypothetical protein
MLSRHILNNDQISQHIELKEISWPFEWSHVFGHRNFCTNYIFIWLAFNDAKDVTAKNRKSENFIQYIYINKWHYVHTSEIFLFFYKFS